MPSSSTPPWRALRATRKHRKDLSSALATGALSLTVLQRMTSRHVGICLNTVIKVEVLLATIVLAFIIAARNTLGRGPKATSNFHVEACFEPGAAKNSRVSDSLLYILYWYLGFEQPVYVLARVRRPRKFFPTYVLVAMDITISLFLLVICLLNNTMI